MDQVSVNGLYARYHLAGGEARGTVAGAPAEPLPQGRVGEQQVHRRGQGRRLRWRDDDAVLPVPDHVRDAAHPGRDDRDTGGHRLQHHGGAGIRPDGRDDGERGSGERLHDLFVVPWFGHDDPGRQAVRQVGRAAADHQQRRAVGGQPGVGVQQDPDALVPAEITDVQQVAARGHTAGDGVRSGFQQFVRDEVRDDLEGYAAGGKVAVSGDRRAHRDDPVQGEPAQGTAALVAGDRGEADRPAVVVVGAADAPSWRRAGAHLLAEVHEALGGADMAVVVQGEHHRRAGRQAQRREAVDDPVVRVDDVGALLDDDAPQCPGHRRVRQRRRVEPVALPVQEGQRRGDRPDGPDTHPVPGCRPRFVTEGDHGDFVTVGQTPAEIVDVSFLTADDRREELGK